MSRQINFLDSLHVFWLRINFLFSMTSINQYQSILLGMVKPIFLRFHHAGGRNRFYEWPLLHSTSDIACTGSRDKKKTNERLNKWKCACVCRERNRQTPRGMIIPKYLDPQGASEKEQLVGFTSDAFWNIVCYAVVAESWVGSVNVSRSREFNFLSNLRSQLIILEEKKKNSLVIAC